MAEFAKVFQRLEGESNDDWAKRIADSIAEDTSKNAKEPFDDEEDF